MKTESWMIADVRTGRRIGSSAYLTRESAESQIREWLKRHDRGGRPDITIELLVNMTVVPNDYT